jgi:hypothetical protein
LEVVVRGWEFCQDLSELMDRYLTT